MTPQPSATEAFERLVLRAAPRVLGYLARRHQPADAADLLSETLIVTWRRFDDAPADDAQATAWMIGVARKLAANHRRAHRRRSEAVERLQAHLMATPTTPDDEERDDVVRALERLRTADREVLTLSVWDGLSGTELALALHCSPETARQRLSRARRRFARELRLLRADENVAHDVSRAAADT